MENTYWNKNGEEQALSDRLSAMIPSRGVADNTHLNLWRLAVNAYYDLHNNGLCNWEQRWQPFRYALYDVYPDDDLLCNAADIDVIMNVTERRPNLDVLIGVMETVITAIARFVAAKLELKN